MMEDHAPSLAMSKTIRENDRDSIKRRAESKLVINEDIEVTEYAPDVFAFLRIMDGYDNKILKESLDPEVNRSMVFKAGESQGKSGSFFFFSKD